MVWFFDASCFAFSTSPSEALYLCCLSVMKSCQVRRSHLTPPTPPHLTKSIPPISPHPSLLIRRGRSENPGSVSHKHGPRIGTVFWAQNWDRIRKWCKKSGPDSGPKKPEQLSAVGPAFALPAHLVFLQCTALLKPHISFFGMLPALGYLCPGGLKTQGPACH